MKDLSSIKAIFSEKTPTLLFKKTILTNFITMLTMAISIFCVLMLLNHRAGGGINYFAPKLLVLMGMIFIGFFLINLYYLKESLSTQSENTLEEEKKDEEEMVIPESHQETKSFDFSDLYHNITIILNKRVEKYGLKHSEQSESHLNNLGKMISHDIRKPFSMLNHYLLFVQDIADPEEIRETTHMFADEMEKAIDSVDNLLKILLEDDYEFKLNKEVVTPEYLIQSALDECLKKYPETDISVSYNYHHNGMVTIDSIKMHKVCVSIIENAITTMTYGKPLIFATREKSMSPFITFCLRNTGATISDAEAQKFFDLFYSHKGKNGNGLELAIAKQIISAHGGKIWCRSSREGNYIEIYFTLPKN